MGTSDPQHHELTHHVHSEEALLPLNQLLQAPSVVVLHTTENSYLCVQEDLSNIIVYSMYKIPLLLVHFVFLIHIFLF